MGNSENAAQGGSVDTTNELAYTVRAASRLRASLAQPIAFLQDLLKAPLAEDAPPEAHTAFGYLDRACCWLQTVRDLQLAAHYQGHAAGLRAIMEITVDLALLLDAPKDDEKIVAYERSAMFKHASAHKAYCERSGSGRGKEATEARDAFIAENEAGVAADRDRFWQGKHPRNRWTGRTLVDDVARVHAKYPQLELDSLYNETYAWACWYVHGSTLTGTRGGGAERTLPASAIALHACGDCAYKAAELAMRLTGKLNPDDVKRLVDSRNSWILAAGGVNLEAA